MIMKQRGIVKKSIVYAIKDKSNCSGCHACYAVCPKNCISMVSDDEGFWYPKVDEAKCVQCGICVEKCPVINEVDKDEIPTAYAALNKELDIRLSSSSGGIFTLLAEHIIDNGGTVFGVAFDNDLNVRHIGINKKKDIQRLQGSKYVQSKIGDCYKKTKKILDAGNVVLFSGTPCQIAGLHSYLGKIYDNLSTVDIFCLGVPSPKAWRKHLEYCGEIEKTMVKSYSFRDKSEGWKNYSTKIHYKDGRIKKIPHQQNPYMRAFLSAVCMRPSCHSCKFKGEQRHSDITLADFWGISNVLPDMDDDKGTSLMLVHSEKAEEILTSIIDKLVIQTVDIDEALMYNSAALYSVKAHPKRQQFLSAVDYMPFDVAVKKYCEPSLLTKMHRKTRGVLSRVKRIIIKAK